MSSISARARRRHARLVNAVTALFLVAVLSPAAAAPVAADTSATVPAGFRDELVWSGLSYPTAVAFSPDASRVFVAQKDGRIKAYDGLTDPTPVTIADLSGEVYDYWDRGLLGMTIDPDFPTRPYLYALYAYDSVPWNDACPTPPGSTTDGCVAMGRLARLTVSNGGAGNTISAKKDLLTDWCQQFPSHSVGTVAFGPDGVAGGLYVSGGEGASFTAPRDSGQFGGSLANTQTPINPCGDPASQGGALRSQDIRTSGDPTGLSGTIVRVDPDTGAAFAGNADIGATDLNDRRIVGYGLRNPFRFTFAPGGGLWIGDVGYSDTEEIDEIPDPDAAPRNFGWPCYEGTAQQAAYWNASGGGVPYDPALCTSLSGQVSPVHRYLHTAEGVNGDGCGTGSSAIAGITFLRDDTEYPDSYDGGLFWTDYNRKCIWFAPRGQNGRPDFSARVRFADLRRSDDGLTNGASVFLGTTPAGDLLYTNFDRGEVRAVRFYPPNAPPSAAFIATPTSGIAPLAVSLNASGSTDSNGDTLTYAWDLDGDGQYDDAAGATTTTTIQDPGDVAIGLKVTDDGVPVLTDTVSHTVHAGNSPPNVTMSTPAASLTWAVGDAIAFSATATDTQDGVLPASAFTWTWAIAHCRPDECHEHVVQTFTGVKSGSFPAPDHPYPSHLKVTLVVKDGDGLSTTVTRDLQPKTGVIAATSSPAGIALHAYAESDLIDLPATGIQKSSIVLEAPATATLGEGSYAFDHWSDGSTDATHTVPVVAGTTTLKATFRLLHTTDAANSCAAAPLERRGPEWRAGRLWNAGDVDWYRFSMAATGTIRVRLADLPVGASLRLYDGCTTLLAAQDRSGTASEEIIRTLPAGTYAVKVTPTAGGSMTPYALQIARLGADLSLQSATSRVSGGTLTLSGEVWNDRSSARGPITVTARLLDASGALLTTWTGPAEVVATGRGRAAFRLTGPLPSGFKSARYTFTASAAATPVTLTTTGLTTTSASNRWRIKGSVGSSKAVHGVRVVMVQYDAHGDVVDVTTATLGKTTLAAGASTTFDAWSPWAGPAPDRVRLIALGVAD